MCLADNSLSLLSDRSAAPPSIILLSRRPSLVLCNDRLCGFDIIEMEAFLPPVVLPVPATADILQEGIIHNITVSVHFKIKCVRVSAVACQLIVRCVWCCKLTSGRRLLVLVIQQTQLEKADTSICKHSSEFKSVLEDALEDALDIFTRL